MGLTNRDLVQIATIVETKTKTIFTEEYLQGVVDKIVKKTHDKYDRIISELKNDMNFLKKENSELRIAMDNMEQISRDRNVRFFGIQENTGEDLVSVVLKVTNHTMKVKHITEKSILKCHRIPNKNTNTDNPSPPAVLVQFVDTTVREKILSSRKNLKSTGISIQEDLTKMRLTLMKSAIDKFSKKHVWCRNGNIFVKYNERVHRVQQESDLLRIK
ncbi:unnamed protein product [Phaedon cochleariae]|uniref:FP protein C-terminal domain-containing protein n=1 Tax=Phaedon cochleariae TaxID=80249 RepID=A0A9N9X4V8_PHACE|nr:unnamed protein product [Phaedon cochleariae]